MAWINPKIDWNTSDYYNIVDINRVENNTDYIADYIEIYALRPSVSTIKTDWNNTEFPFFDELNRIENNIEVIKNSMATPTGWTTSKVDWLSLNIYVDANRLENNLSLLKTMSEAINDGFLSCGSFVCGEGTEL